MTNALGKRRAWFSYAPDQGFVTVYLDKPPASDEHIPEWYAPDVKPLMEEITVKQLAWRFGVELGELTIIKPDYASAWLKKLEKERIAKMRKAKGEARFAQTLFPIPEEVEAQGRFASEKRKVRKGK